MVVWLLAALAMAPFLTTITTANGFVNVKSFPKALRVSARRLSAANVDVPGTGTRRLNAANVDVSGSGVHVFDVDHGVNVTVGRRSLPTSHLRELRLADDLTRLREVAALISGQRRRAGTRRLNDVVAGKQTTVR